MTDPTSATSNHPNSHEEYFRWIVSIHVALQIPSDYRTLRKLAPYIEASDLVPVEGQLFLAPPAALQWHAMKNAAAKDDIQLLWRPFAIKSGARGDLVQADSYAPTERPRFAWLTQGYAKPQPGLSPLTPSACLSLANHLSLLTYHFFCSYAALCSFAAICESLAWLLAIGYFPAPRPLG